MAMLVEKLAKDKIDGDFQAEVLLTSVGIVRHDQHASTDFKGTICASISLIFPQN